MKDMTLIFSSLAARGAGTLLSVFLTGFGVMLALLVLQFSYHVQNRLGSDGKGIDIVIGAKGSPLQLILSSVYHIDIPTGNIRYDDVEKWMKHPQVRTAIPLALGDNAHGYRIVGTTDSYMTHYNAQLARGRIWRKPFEAVAGSSVALKLNESFAGAHGLERGGPAHQDGIYTIVGVMKPTGTVLDRLILTSLDSVLEIHGLAGVARGHKESYHHHDDDNHRHDDNVDHTAEPVITAVLMTTKTPIANMNLPRLINGESSLQAASPAFEMARLTAILGVGWQSIKALSAILIILAALSIFTGLAGSLENRGGDLAILRAVGYSRRRLLRIIIGEGMIIVLCGLLIGFVLGIGSFAFMSHAIAPLAASGAKITIIPAFGFIILGVMLAGLAGSLIPALRAVRVDVARQLSRNT